jgi:hypothetical protein
MILHFNKKSLTFWGDSGSMAPEFTASNLITTPFERRREPMETTITLIANLVILFKQLHIVMEARNLWTLAAMTALLVKGKRAHLYELGKALPCKGKVESRVQKLRRWVSNPTITPKPSIGARLTLLAPLLAECSTLTLIIDRTEWTRLGVHLNLFLCSLAFNGRSVPIFWLLLPKRGCSSFDDQKALLTPVLAGLATHPTLSCLPIRVVADREFCSPPLAKWLKGLGIHWAIRVKKSYRVSRSDMPSTRLSMFFAHCQPGTYYFFSDLFFTAEHRFRAHLFLYWRPDCQEPLAIMTDLDEAVVVDECYHERMFIETLNRDIKSSGYDIERGRMTDATRLENLLIPIAFAYILSVIQGHVEELNHPRPPLHKRRLSLFTQARNRFNDLFDRTALTTIMTFFRQFFHFLTTLLVQKIPEDTTILFQRFAKQQHILLQGVT